MPIFLICIILFTIIIRVKLKRSDSSSSAANENFWEREHQANFARAKDITTLDYINTPDDLLPFGDTTDERELDLQKQVQNCLSTKMLNLSQYTNTDLKEQFGIANLEALSDYDQNFLTFSHALNNWGVYRYEQKDFENAKIILEYALSLRCDISSIYITLGHIYAHENDLAKLDGLIEDIKQSEHPLKESIAKQLQLCRLKD